MEVKASAPLWEIISGAVLHWTKNWLEISACCGHLLRLYYLWLGERGYGRVSGV